MEEGVSPIDSLGWVVNGKGIGPAKVTRVEECSIGAIHGRTTNGRDGAPVGPEQDSARRVHRGKGHIVGNCVGRGIS